MYRADAQVCQDDDAHRSDAGGDEAARREVPAETEHDQEENRGANRREFASPVLARVYIRRRDSRRDGRADSPPFPSSF